jgi:hypothetical protein
MPRGTGSWPTSRSVARARPFDMPSRSVPPAGTGASDELQHLTLGGDGRREAEGHEGDPKQ